MTKQYGYNDLAGCVTQRRSQETGHLYGLYNAEQAQIDGGYMPDNSQFSDEPRKYPWVTVCEDHGTICGHASLALARMHLPTGGWCEKCMGEGDPGSYAERRVKPELDDEVYGVVGSGEEAQVLRLVVERVSYRERSGQGEDYADLRDPSTGKGYHLPLMCVYAHEPQRVTHTDQFGPVAVWE